MLDGVMLLWFILTAASVLYVAVDIVKTPEAVVLKWGFVILTLFSGPLGAFFYVLGCREPLPGTHEQYVSARWRQVLGSTMHCAAGDGLGILAGAVLAYLLRVDQTLGIAIEYVTGFAFGWAFFQAYAMKDMAGGDYVKSLKMTFIPEFFSMNLLMAGMVLVSRFWMSAVVDSGNPLNPAFWFIMSMALIVGFLCAYPMNWWLVTNGLKHGMMTVRQESNRKKTDEHAGEGASDPAMHGGHDMSRGNEDHAKHAAHDHAGKTEHEMSGSGHSTPPSTSRIAAVGILSVALLGISVAIVLTLANPSG